MRRKLKNVAVLSNTDEERKHYDFGAYKLFLSIYRLQSNVFIEDECFFDASCKQTKRDFKIFTGNISHKKRFRFRI
jgi:hypothetical protein